MAEEFRRVIDSKFMKEIGTKGGRSRSDAKREAARTNQKKAMEAKKRARLGQS
jgi:hypothetical protein